MAPRLTGEHVSARDLVLSGNCEGISDAALVSLLLGDPSGRSGSEVIARHPMPDGLWRLGAHDLVGIARVGPAAAAGIALSHAINRKEIIDTVFVGQGKPWQAAPLEGTPFYNKQLATQYLEYDVAKANEYLDKAGLKKGADGMRTRPDGKPLTIVLEIANANISEVDTGNMLAKYWVTTKAVEMSR